jgi:hypothetical protein
MVLNEVFDEETIQLHGIVLPLVLEYVREELIDQ